MGTLFFINKAILVGKVNDKPELKKTKDGTSVCNFQICTEKRWKDKEGKLKEFVEWHNVVAWGKIAYGCAKWLHKGANVYIEGELKTQSWDDPKGGPKRFKTSVQIRIIDFLEKEKKEGVGPEEEDLEQAKIEDFIPPDTGDLNI